MIKNIKIKTNTNELISLEELINQSDIIRSPNIKNNNNVLGNWIEIFQPLADKIKKEKLK